ncbi:family S53 protease-like protein [Mycena filopes]|nr:family S53 protease-like protein [Mycena filopes]
MRSSKLLVSILLATVATGRMVVHENRSSPPSGFVSLGPAPNTEMLTLRVALASSNVAGLEQKLTSLATAGSTEFRQWLSMEEVAIHMKPSATVTTFNTWASANGLHPTPASPNGDWVLLTLPVSQANTLFAANFERFTHPSVSGTLIRTLSVSLPSELVGHVDVVHPTVDFVGIDPSAGPPTIREGGAAHPTSCDTSVPGVHMNPACLQELYGIPKAPATQKSNHLLVTAYLEQFAEQADLSTFLEKFRPDISPNTTFSLLTLGNGTNPQGPGIASAESDLDIQYTVGIATGVPVQFLSVGGGLSIPGFVTSLLDTTVYLDGVENPPAVMSTSYIPVESDIGISLATKICNGYMALGARGISVIFAAGDGGPRGGHDSPDVCADNVFSPVFPASCPYVTAVGGTIGLAPEKAVNLTGGGFSNYFPAPAYQSAAIDGFLKTVPSNFAGVFNRTGRGYPDVAAQAWNFDVIFNGAPLANASGTSAAAPTFASIIALINDRLVAAGRPVLGFLNPFIYSRASKAFTDITIGHNSGYMCPASTVAFDAVAGWDALTGLGTPIFSKLLAAAMEYE